MTSWEDLLNKRRPIASVSNSAHMLECMNAVLGKYPKAQICTENGMFKLVNESLAMSNYHNSHYACWIEAREAMNESGK